jgi:hypothetical protein
MSFKAEVYSYSRSRGVFAGLAIDGTVISIDDDENEAFYGKHGVTASDIAAGAVNPPANDDSARRFLTAVTKSTRGEQQASAVPASASAAPNPSQPAAPAQPSPLSSGSGTQSFPAEDSQPGREPQPTQR